MFILSNIGLDGWCAQLAGGDAFECAAVHRADFIFVVVRQRDVHHAAIVPKHRVPISPDVSVDVLWDCAELEKIVEDGLAFFLGEPIDA